MSEHNLIQSMTNEELRREIAEAMGWYVRPFAFGFEAAIERDGRIFTVGCADSVDQAWEVAMLAEHGIPNWPEADGAAFRLVIDVLDRLNNTRHKPVWELRVSAKSVFFARLWIGEPQEAIGDSRTWNEVDARALSELAALALRRLSDG